MFAHTQKNARLHPLKYFCPTVVYFLVAALKLKLKTFISKWEKLREGLDKKAPPQAVERMWEWTPKFSNFYYVFKNNLFTA